MKKQFHYSMAYFKLVRWYLASILLFLPFQSKIAESNIINNHNVQYLLRMIDEITIVVFAPLALIILIKDRKNINYLYFLIGFPIILFSISGLTSGIVNGNSLFVTCLGTFDYIKNILVIYIYCAFFKEFRDLKKIYYILLIVVIFLGAIALIQEIWAIVLRHIIGEDITHKKIYILTNIYNSLDVLSFGDANIRWRHGLYRAESLIGKPFVLGLYSLLFFTIYILNSKKVNWVFIVLILSSVFVSLSRMVYTAFVFIIALFFLKDKKWVIIAFIPLLMFTGYMAFRTADSDSSELQEQSYRAYSRDKSIEIWKDHTLWGVGPGMYGGAISIKFPSHIYEEYNFSSQYFNEGLYKWKSLDQFWPQILAETGIVGCLGFAGIIISLILTLASLNYRAVDNEQRSLVRGLLFYMTVVNIYLLSSGLNLTPVIYTYLAFVGIALGSINNRNVDSNLSVTPPFGRD